MTVLEDVRPALEIEYFEVVRARRSIRVAAMPKVSPSIVSLFEKLRARYELAIGEYCVVQSGDNPVPLFVAINVSATATLEASEKIALTISEAE